MGPFGPELGEHGHSDRGPLVLEGELEEAPCEVDTVRDSMGEFIEASTTDKYDGIRRLIDMDDTLRQNFENIPKVSLKGFDEEVFSLARNIKANRGRLQKLKDDVEEDRTRANAQFEECKKHGQRWRS